MGKIRRSPVWDDPRVKPPYGSVEIDWGHPLASGLVFLALVNEGAGRLYDLAGGSSSLTNAYTWVPTARGVATSNHGNTNKFPNSSAIATASPVSIFASVFYDGGTGEAIVAQATGDDSGPPRWSVRVGGGGQLSLNAMVGGVTKTATDPPGWFPTAAYHTCGGTIQPADTTTGTRVYVNGKNTATDACGALDTAGTGILSYGATQGGSAWSGHIIVLAIWAREVSSPEHLWLANEPYAYLRPLIRRRYFVPAAAAAAGGSAAHRRLMTLGVGS